MNLFTIALSRTSHKGYLSFLETCSGSAITYPERTALKWLFPWEIATFHSVGKGTSIGKPL
jgi:hypothetical protein